ncbi:PREDICTED: uncharacterized protein LOC104814410 [Tarenaya hassleriana]|uniref:uncharacterized protein LOC104814410 n=1 Tax=Tarenaya hassleriana TaxID=28532 RepID=UPI00053C60B6|nr:PREDICTED: uncharacterized protein LOC104814410 [Tarenaya hassleriana]
MESRDSFDPEDQRIVHVREALMSPGGGGVPTLRTARFLNYTITAIDDDVFELPLEAFASRPETFEPDKWPVRFSFSGWASPSVNWIEWVNAMAELHAQTWRKSGGHDALMASRYHIKRQDDLMMALVEKWCVETNSFVFPWGEATVTLEDMIVLGGFSAIGNNVLGSIKREEMKSAEERLKMAKREISANSGKKVSVSLWMKETMNSRSEIEHEAFMVTWLSRFVFPFSSDLVRDKLFPAAVQLARGVRLALAPTILAGIYRDLGILKEKLAGSIPFKNVEEETEVVVMSPFQFVQVWAWERIMAVRPSQPNKLKHSEPRMAQWHHLGGQESNPKPANLRSVLDMAGASFEYRPYAKPLKNFRFPKFYVESDCNVSVESDEEIVAFGRCLRFSKLVGLDCVEPYYPHRVAMQFGYDMDIPGVVPARVETPEVAWKEYIRPISDGMMYIPSRFHEADVTFGYIRWWKQSVSALQSAAKRSSSFQKPLLSPGKEKPGATMAATTTTESPPIGKSKTMGAKAEVKDQEVVKRVMTETKERTFAPSSRIPEKRKKAKSESISRVESLTGSEQGGMQQPKGKETGFRKKTELAKKSPTGLTKSPGRSLSDVPDLRGALRGPRETKGHGHGHGHGHVTFDLPGSPRNLPKAQSLSPKPSSKDPPVRTIKPLPRVAERTKQSIFHRPDPKQTLSAPPRKNETVRIPRETATTRPRATKKQNDSSSSSSSLPLRRKKYTRSLANIPHGSSSSENNHSTVKQKAHQIKAAEETSSKETQSEANALKFLDEMVTLKEHIGEEGEVTYQIPKAQFEVFSQGVQEVLLELQTIKSALNI